MMCDDSQHQNWTLEHYEVEAGNGITPRAKVVLKDHRDNTIHKSEKTGTGMVDAAYQAIEDICGTHGELTEFGMDAVTSGLDAQAIVNLRLEQENGKVVCGRAGDTDVIKASIYAYLDALNKVFVSQNSA